MKFSYNWLKELVPALPMPKDLGQALTDAGIEVEGITPVSSGLSGVVSAEVMEVKKHPNADRLNLCEVKIDSASYSIVCGADNMKPGDKVALALPGAILPGGVSIKKSKIRGIESSGMMCSESELGLKDASVGIMILPQDAPLGVDINTALGLNDFMLEVNIMPNRPDILSIEGLAREIGAVLAVECKAGDFYLTENGAPIEKIISAVISEDGLCRRYCARVIEGVEIRESPWLIKSRLKSHGIRAVNNIVDATNYIMLLTGHPLHAFDLDRIIGSRIEVRQARHEERIETIDGGAMVLNDATPVIADAERAVAIAGIMGGKATEIGEATKRVLLEAASFNPPAVRRASKRLGLSTDSSYRFERGVDPDGVARALDAAGALMNLTAGGSVAKGAIDEYPAKPIRRTIRFRVDRAEKLLGMDLKAPKAMDVFARLGIEACLTQDDVIDAIPPGFRQDLVHEIDLAEEVARICGYKSVLETVPASSSLPPEPCAQTLLKRKIRALLSSDGFFEVINFSFISGKSFNSTGGPDRGRIGILNPLSEDQSILRDSLISSLLGNLDLNLSRKTEDIRIFEIAPVFLSTDESRAPKEQWRVSGLIYGLRYGLSWNMPKDGVDFYDIKGAVERLVIGLAGQGAKIEFRPPLKESPLSVAFHPGKSAAITLSGVPAGTLGELHPDILQEYGLKNPAYAFEMDLEAISSLAGSARVFKELPRFPESTRDIAFLVETQIPYSEIIKSLEQLGAKVIEKVELFDVYYGVSVPKDQKSLAIRLTYRSIEKTLTAEEVDEVHSRAIDTLVKRFNAVVRDR
ncbi:MAG: phenylalanine--tRNA ligase subunit beta [Deltaproteobacteria bacterium]